MTSLCQSMQVSWTVAGDLNELLHHLKEQVVELKLESNSYAFYMTQVDMIFGQIIMSIPVSRIGYARVIMSHQRDCVVTSNATHIDSDIHVAD